MRNPISFILFLFYYIFYKLYSWAKRLGVDDAPEWTALFTVSWFPFLNTLTLIVGIGLVSGDRIQLPIVTWSTKITFLLVYLVFHYFIFIHKGKYKLIVEHFRNETEEKGRRGTIYTTIYIILTFGLFFSSIYLMSLRNRGVI